MQDPPGKGSRRNQGVYSRMRYRCFQKHLVLRTSTTLLSTLLVILFVVGGFWVEQVAASEQEELEFYSEDYSNSSFIDDGNETTIEPTPSPLEVSFDGVVTMSSSKAHHDASDGILFPWLVQLLGCCAVFVLERYNIPVPYAAVMFAIGALMGSLAVMRFDSGDPTERTYLQDSILTWVNIDSSLLLLIFLPGLIFKDAVDIPINLFLVAWGQIWILAFPMVLVGTALTAVAAIYCLPYESEDPSSYGWFAWLVLGAILSSTDPIAVASVLKTAGASPRLVMHIAGESLLNDGSSYVFFLIFAQLWYGYLGLEGIGTLMAIDTISDGIEFMLRMSLGGMLVGSVFGFGLLAVLWVLDRKLERDFDIIQVVFGLTTAYLCYYVCDQIIEMSGVIATVACGIVVNRYGRGLVHDKELMSSYLALADFLLNTLLFALGGLIWAAISFSSDKSSSITSKDFGYLMIFYLLITIIRFIQVGMFYPILSRIGLKSNWKEGIFLAFGGLHGSVGVALGLSLIQYVFQNTDNMEIKNAATILQFLGGGATLLTLTINGTSAGAVLRLLGLVKPPISAEYVEHIFEGAAKDFVYNETTRLFQEKRFRNVNFEVLRKHVPFTTKEPPKLYNSALQGEGNHHLDTTIQKFHQRLVGQGEQYVSLLQATKHASRRSLEEPSSREECQTDLLVEMRQIFLELLREAYTLQEEMGELDDQHKGFLFDILIQSVDLAINEVRYDNKGIEDWQHTGMFFQWNGLLGRRDSLETASASSQIQKPVDDTAAAVANDLSVIKERDSNHLVDASGPTRLRTSALSVDLVSVTKSLLSILSLEGNREQHGKKKTQKDPKRIRLDVLRALAFQHGHKMAEAKLRFYVNRLDTDKDEGMRARHLISEEALDAIISESRAQVALAQKMLREQVRDGALEIILSHYCAKILVRRLQRFTDEKSREGMIGKKETRNYMNKLKEALLEINSSTIEKLAESRVSSNTANINGVATKTINENESSNIPIEELEVVQAPSGLSEKSRVSDLGSDKSWIGDPNNCF